MRYIGHYAFALTTLLSISPSLAKGSSPPTTTLPAQDSAPSPLPDNAGAVAEISQLATSSSCARYRWKDRSVAPSGYMAGMAVSFAKSLCRQRDGESSAVIMAQQNTQNSAKDALDWYKTRFDGLEMEVHRSGAETLRSIYTLGIGLGMRETSGKYCEGYDTTARGPTSVTAETGLFQFSYNSMNASSQLRALYNEYRAAPSSCQLATFRKNVTCRARGVVGSGAGADFQRFTKSCPAFAAEYAMVTLRILRKHYGPINRREAEINASCNDMLDRVQEYVTSRPKQVCAEL